MEATIITLPQNASVAQAGLEGLALMALPEKLMVLAVLAEAAEAEREQTEAALYLPHNNLASITPATGPAHGRFPQK